jgi:small subunit ribosomal protein S8
MMTDPIADMLTRIRNANRVERPVVDMPATKLKLAVAQVLQDEGFIHDYHVGFPGRDDEGHPIFTPETDMSKPHVVLRVALKYGIQGERVIRKIDRASRPGRRLYRGYRELRPVLDGLGIAIISTNKGVMSDRRARAQKLGGEILCTVW